MNSHQISISDNGTVTVPNKVRMTLAEIADLFGINYRTAKQHIRAIEKSGVIVGDYSDSVVVESSTIYTDYYGLEMVITVAFRVQSAKAEMFRQFVIRKMNKTTAPQTILLTFQDQILN